MRTSRTWLSASITSPTLVIAAAAALAVAGGCGDEFVAGGEGATSSGGSGTGGSGGTTSCTPGDDIPCYDGPPETEGVGVCMAGVGTCNAEGTGVTACREQVLPGVEDCAFDGDEDCNGLADDHCASWSKGYPTGNSFDPVGIAAGGSNRIALTGNCSEGIAFGSQVLSCSDDGGDAVQAFVAIVGSTGSLGWGRSFGGTGTEQEAADAAFDANGDVYVTGFYAGELGLNVPTAAMTASTGFVAKFEPGTESPLWAFSFGTAADEQAGTAIAATADGAVVVGYFLGSVTLEDETSSLVTLSAETPAADALVAKLSTAGKAQWATSFTGSEAQRARDVAVDSAGNIFVVGDFYGNATLGGSGEVADPTGSGAAGFVVKLGGDGTHLWERVLGGNGNQRIHAVAVDGPHLAIVGALEEGADIDFGDGELPGLGTESLFVASLNADDGAVRWGKVFGADLHRQQVTDVVVDGDGRIAFTGELTGTVDFGGGPLVVEDTDGRSDVMLVAFEADGSHLYSRRFGSPADDDGAGLALASSGALLLYGEIDDDVDFGDGPLTHRGLFLAHFDAP